MRESGVAAERFFASPIPYRSADADTLIERFSVVTASIAYEGDIPTFFKWLNGAHIPLSPYEREEGRFPVVGMGGALSYINPLTLSGVCDFIVLGDGMDVMGHILKCLRAWESGISREELWQRLAESDYILVPPVDIVDGRLVREPKIGRTLDLNGPYPAHSVWMTKRGVFGKTLLLELQRGCARSCSYCTLPCCFGKMRWRRIETIEKAFNDISARFEVPQVGLVTPEAGDYPLLPRLIDTIMGKQVAISFASLRLDRLNERMISALTSGGRHSITVAPETGGEALRFSCGKKFTDQMILEKLVMTKDAGIDHVKLYFMVGLPHENDEDISAMTSLCRRIIAETGQSLTLSVNPFVPKPQTPWRREQFCGRQAIRRKYEKIKKDIRTITKKTPQLRLTGMKEAETEFKLAWYGYAESRQLAENIEAGVKDIPVPDRERTAEELSRFK